MLEAQNAGKMVGEMTDLHAPDSKMREHASLAEWSGSVISRAAEGRPRVRIFGEMVALLWAEGMNDAALGLEGLWNDLRKLRPFSLLCADEQVCRCHLRELTGISRGAAPAASFSASSAGEVWT